MTAATAKVPPFDIELDAPLRAILAGRPSMTSDLIAARRAAGAAARLTDDDIARGGAFRVSEHSAHGPRGPVPLLVCMPAGASATVPVVYNTHGGGMVAGHNRSSELIGELDRAQVVGCALVSVDYRLAPEHPDPAPIEDCWAGLTWLLDNGADLGVDTGRVVLSGNSAGGALAAGLALLVRDRRRVGVIGQLLQFPMLDDRCDSPSMSELHTVGMWDGLSNRTGWDALLGARRATADVSYYASPARASDLSGVAPAFIEVGSVEALRDEGVDYATRLWRAGGRCELHVWSGAFHSFDEWVPDALVSTAAQDARVNWLRRTLAAVGHIA